MYQINETGIQQLTTWLEANAKTCTKGMIAYYIDKLEESTNNGWGFGHMELSAFRAKAGCPITVSFGEECFDKLEGDC